MDKKLILNRLKEVENLNTDADLARYLGISRSTLSNWNKRNSLDYDLLFSKCEHLSIDWLLTGEGSRFKNDENYISKAVPTSRKTRDAIYSSQRIPLFNLEATMGLVPLLGNNGNDDERVIDYLTIPNLPSCDGSIYATGDSMYPLLKAGDIVAYKSIPLGIDNIFFGEMYVLAIFIDDETTFKTIKFVKPSEKGEGFIKLVSQNQHHADKHIKITQISAMALVRATVRIQN